MANRPMLSAQQLSDLFRRLDADGSGELDLEEFKGLAKKLKIDATGSATHSLLLTHAYLLTHLLLDEYITSIFNKIDTTGNGSLDSSEFIAAYQLLYAGTNAPKIGAVVEGEENHFEYVRAIRYGKDEKGRYIYELYMGEVKSINIKVSLTNLGRYYYI